MKTEDRRKLGKQTRAAGQRFELKVRHDLESKGWIVSKWSNNVEFEEGYSFLKNKFENCNGKLIPAKHKFNFFRKAMTMGSGFPDFICIQPYGIGNSMMYNVRLVESKMAGKLDKIEKEKCDWIKENLKIPVIIASKGEKRGEVKYDEY